MKQMLKKTLLTAAIITVIVFVAIFLFNLIHFQTVKPIWQTDISANFPLFLILLSVLSLFSYWLARLWLKNFPEKEKQQLYHFFDPQRFPEKRIHLRYHPGKNSTMLINAQKVVYLNDSAATMAILFLKNYSDQEALAFLKKKYRASPERLLSDYRQTIKKISELISRDDICPITFMDIEKIQSFSMPLEVPLRIDLAITYQCNNNCNHCYNRKKDTRELQSPEWKQVISKLAQIGVPHIAFTGGEPTLREDLPELIAFAEDSGIICGLISNGVRLADKEYLLRLKQAGLDYAQITLNSHIEEIHNRCAGASTFQDTVQGIKNCLQEKVYLITNTTINRTNQTNIEEIVDFLKSLGVKTFAMNSVINSGKARNSEFALNEDELIPILKKVRDAAVKNEMKFIWYSPTRYCELNPVELDIGIKSCTAGKYNFAIEPDGTVIPCQSLYHPVGNILTEEWEKIFNHRFLKELRNRDWKLEKCNSCQLLAICGCGCPLQIKDDSFCCPDLLSNS